MSTELITEHWYGDDGISLTVTCDDRSFFAEITAPKAEVSEIYVEILYRARDATGFTIGPAVSVFHQMIKMQVRPESTQCFARFWLPRNLAGRLRESFFRIRRTGPLSG